VYNIDFKLSKKYTSQH